MSQVTVQNIPSGLAAHLQNLKPKAENEGGIPVPGTEPTPTPTPPVSDPIPTPEPEVEELVNQAEPAATPDPTPTPTSDSEPDWLDLDAPVLGSDQQTATPTPTLEEKAKVLDSLFAHPDTELVLKAFQAGKTLADIVKEYQIVDYNSMNEEDVLLNYGQFMGYKDDQLDSVRDWFNSLPQVQKDRELKLMKAELESSQSDKKATLVRGYEEKATNQAEAQRKMDAEIARVAESMVNKELFGVKLTQKDAEDFSKWVRTDFNKVFRPDGTLDGSTLRNFWIGATRISTIQKAHYAKGKSEGTTEVLKEVHRPNLQGAAVTSLPKPKTVANPHEQARNAASAIGKGTIKPISH